MTPAAEGEWDVEVRLHGRTFGTEEQARETAERWRQLVATAAQRDVELLEVVVRDTATGCRTDECLALVRHGPGHQSRTRCGKHGPHEVHEAFLEVAGDTVYWRGYEGCTGAFGESPLDEDDPYTHVEARGYFIVCCRTCDDGRPLPQPFTTEADRMAWYRAHAEGTGHQDFFVLDPSGEVAQLDDVPTVRWIGTVAFEGVKTTDGRWLEQLEWPDLVSGPLPVVELGTGTAVGTITEAWREDHPTGGVAIRARGTVAARLIEGGRLALGVDVDRGDLVPLGDGIIMRSGRLRGLTVYPEPRDAEPAWPECALEVEEQEAER